MSWWFVRISPTGENAAGGHDFVQENGQVIGPGTGPRYQDHDTIFYGRQPDGAFMRWDRGSTPVVVREQGFNFYDIAPDGRWMGYRADPPRVIWSDGGVWEGWADGDISNTRWAARQHSNSALWAGTGQGQNGRLVDARGCSDVRLLEDILVWSVGDHIYAQRSHGARIEDWSIAGQSHFWPVPVVVGTKLYVLTHTFDRLLLYEAKEGQTHGYVVTTGITDMPDALHMGGNRVRVVWSNRGELGERFIDLTDSEVDLRDHVPVEDTSGQTFDLLPYFVPAPGRRQRSGAHEMCWHVDDVSRRVYEIRFDVADSWVCLSWDDNWIYLYEDRAQSEPNHNPSNDYSLTDARWVPRWGKVGDTIDHPNNIKIRWDPRTNKYHSHETWPYRTKIVTRYSEIDMKGDIGVDEAVAIEFWPLHPRGNREIALHGKNWSLVQWQTNVFNIIGGARTLTPTKGARDANPWPPPQVGGGKVGVTFQSPSFPLNVKVGDKTQFVLKRDGNWPSRIRWWRRLGDRFDVTDWRNPQHDPDHTWEWTEAGKFTVGIEWDGGGTGARREVTVAAQGGGGGNPGGGTGVVPSLSEMSDLHNRLEDTYHIDPARHPELTTRVDAGGRIGWTHNYLGRRAGGVGHEPAIRAVENQIDETEGRAPRWGGGPVNPPPPPSGDWDRIDGQLGLEPGGGFHVNGRPVLPTLAHYGDALSKWMRDPDHVLRNLDLMASVGYHGVRYWTCLDGDWWAGRHVGEAFQPNYWERHRAFFIALKERGLVAQISQGSTTQDALPDPHGFMNRLCDTLQDVGPEVCCVLEGVNEDRDTGNKGPRWLADFVSIARRRFPGMLLGLSSYTGTEDPDILNRYSIDPANMFMVHPYRGGHNHDKTRHLMSLQYENGANARMAMSLMGARSSRETNAVLDDITASRQRTALETAEYLIRYFPHRQDEIDRLLMLAGNRTAMRSAIAREAEKLMRRNGWNSEGPGGGSRVSAIDNRDAMTGATMAGLAAMSFAMRMGYVWFSGVGVISDEHETFEMMPGFREVPQVRKLVPHDIMRYSGPIFHGGETWRNERTFAAQGDTRADHVIHSDGRRLVMIYGPSGLDVPQSRGLNVEVDERWGNEFRVVFGRE
jgi:hypothetical protein